MILVTGATGKVGAELVRQLVEAQQPVRALVRDPEKAARALPPEVELARGDLDDVPSIAAALEGVTRLFLLSPPSEQMLRFERNAVAAVKDAGGVGHIVKLSVMGVDPSAASFFAREHAAAEAAVRESGVPFTFLRPNFFMQNLLAAAPQIKSQRAIYQPGGEQAASHIDARDVAAVAAAVLADPAAHPGRAYTLTGPESLTFQQVAEILSRVVGQPIRYVDVPRDAAKQAMLAGGMPPWYAEAISQLMDDFRAGKMAAVTDDVERVTGAKPRTFEQFAREHRDTFA